MRRAVLAAIVLCGCYAPQAPAGAPCDLRHPCPSGQSCVVGICGGVDHTVDAPMTSMVDAMVDGMITATDIDGDGVANTTDNCPNYSNPNQANEDGDPLGDKCDPCPIDPASPPSDPDNDGVSDSCDPRPNTAGDTLVLFEGFKGGVVPSNWQVQGGPASPAGDGVNLNNTAYAGIVPPVNMPGNGMVMIKGTILQTLGNNDSTLAIVMRHEPTQDKGMYCELYAPNAGSTNGREIDIWDSAAQIERGKQAYAWQTNVAYTLAERANGNTINCAATPMAGTPVSINASGTTPGANTGAFIYAANVNIAWMLVVSSP